MTHNISNLLYMALFSLCVLGCSDDEEGPAKDLRQISSNSWKIESVETHQSVAYNFMGQQIDMDTTMMVTDMLDPCEYDVAYEFKEDQQILYTLSQTYCGKPINGDYTWKLSDNKTQMVFYGEDGMVFMGSASGLTVLSNEIALDIIEVNDKIMRLKYILPYQEFLQNLSGVEGLEMMEEMGIDIEGSIEVDFTFVTTTE